MTSRSPLMFYIFIMIVTVGSQDSLIQAQTTTSTEIGQLVLRTTQPARTNTNTTIYAWSSWGKWTPCSRTCGGGVAVQERYCLPRDPSRLRRSRKRRKLVRRRVRSMETRRIRDATDPEPVPDCPGLARRYHECNTAPCPGSAKDHRGEQCSVYDRRPFRGHFYTWVPYVDGDSPCTLNCRPRGQQFYASLALVTDGTPCTRPGFRAICVQGSCKFSQGTRLYKKMERCNWETKLVSFKNKHNLLRTLYEPRFSNKKKWKQIHCSHSYTDSKNLCFQVIMVLAFMKFYFNK